MKWAGAAIIITVCYTFGRFIARDEYEKARALDSLLRLFSYMKRRIYAERAPVFEIFSSFSDAYLEECGFLSIIRSHRYGLPSLWKEAVEALRINNELKPELIHFGDELGRLPLDEQLKRIDGITAFINSERDALKEVLPKKQKSIRSFWLLTGILTVIILF